LPGIIAPVVVGALVSAPHNDAAHWRIAFWISAAITVAGWLTFVWLGSAELVDFHAAAPSQPSGKIPGSPPPSAPVLAAGAALASATKRRVAGDASGGGIGQAAAAGPVQLHSGEEETDRLLHPVGSGQAAPSPGQR